MAPARADRRAHTGHVKYFGFNINTTEENGKLCILVIYSLLGSINLEVIYDFSIIYSSGLNGTNFRFPEQRRSLFKSAGSCPYLQKQGECVFSFTHTLHTHVEREEHTYPAF